MRNVFFGLVLAATTAAAQSYQPVYLMGGYWTTNTVLQTRYNTGLWIADVQRGRYSSLARLGNFCYAAKTDADNRRILFTVVGGSGSITTLPYSGLFRYDLATQTVQTIAHDPKVLYQPYDVVVDQDGNYVFTCVTQTTSSTLHVVFKYDTTAGRITTLMTAGQVGGRFNAAGKLVRDVDTGNLLVVDGSGWQRVYSLDDQGTVQTWSPGGWPGARWNAPQNLATGDLEGPVGTSSSSQVVYRLGQGSSQATSLYWLGRPVGFNFSLSGWPAAFDLQTAAQPRWVLPGYYGVPTTGNAEAAVFYVDAQTYFVQARRVPPAQPPSFFSHYYFYHFAFYGNRHIQTVLVGPRKWRIYLSAPRFAGRPYALALGVAGTRPGIRLPDGRRVLMNPEPLLAASVFNQLQPVFNPGPLVLDSRGEAQGQLDLSRVPRLGIPLWLTLVILDPQAPFGLAYISEPYVMRI